MAGRACRNFPTITTPRSGGKVVYPRTGGLNKVCHVQHRKHDHRADGIKKRYNDNLGIFFTKTLYYRRSPTTKGFQLGQGYYERIASRMKVVCTPCSSVHMCKLRARAAQKKEKDAQAMICRYPINLTSMIRPVELRSFRDVPESHVVLCFIPTHGIRRHHHRRRRPRSD